MSDHLQLQLRDLGDQISKIVSNHSSLRVPAEEAALGRMSEAGGLDDRAPGNIFDDKAEVNSAMVDNDIAEVEKMLQQWLVARGKSA